MKLSAYPNGFVQFNPWNLPAFTHLPPLPAFCNYKQTLSTSYGGIQLHQNRLTIKICGNYPELTNDTKHELFLLPMKTVLQTIFGESQMKTLKTCVIVLHALSLSLLIVLKLPHTAFSLYVKHLRVLSKSRRAKVSQVYHIITQDNSMKLKPRN